MLVVEDEFLVALDMRTILTEAGFQVLGHAGSVAAAISLICRQHPDAVLLDNNLNGRSVAPVAVALSARGVPFAFVTGNDRKGLPAAFAGAPAVRKWLDSAWLVAMARRLTE